LFVFVLKVHRTVAILETRAFSLHNKPKDIFYRIMPETPIQGILERILYGNEETGFTVAKIKEDRRVKRRM